jgi:hypothetical protein
LEQLGAVEHARNPRTWETEMGRIEVPGLAKYPTQERTGMGSCLARTKP